MTTTDDAIVREVNANRAVFETQKVVSQYRHETQLTPAEARLLDRYHSSIVHQPVLDLGVGGGRTTPHLAPLASSYLGMDFSHAMIEACRNRYPSWEFRWGDARDLSELPAESFNFVIFAFNGIDYVDHDDRCRILRQVARVLKPNGVFLFSSHNLGCLPRGTFLRWIFRVEISLRPLHIARTFARIGLRLWNYGRNAYRQHRNDNCAILIDPAHEFTLTTYYITPDEQRRQLIDAGFSSEIEVEADDNSSVPYAFYYAARKPRVD